jgi:deoxyribonuclease (pyrimidine dimer)
MTRINLIKPEDLCDQHLVAEIKEINQLSGSFKKSCESKLGIQKKKIPEKFTLNTGHVYFFYDKGKYLHNRFNSLKEEAIKRGFNIQTTFQNDWEGKTTLYKDWEANTPDYRIVTQRIIEKIRLKKDWYRYKGKSINYKDYIKMIIEKYR